jgi:hypothetical protein
MEKSLTPHRFAGTVENSTRGQTANRRRYSIGIPPEAFEPQCHPAIRRRLVQDGELKCDRNLAHRRRRFLSRTHFAPGHSCRSIRIGEGNSHGDSSGRWETQYTFVDDPEHAGNGILTVVAGRVGNVRYVPSSRNLLYTQLHP